MYSIGHIIEYEIMNQKRKLGQQGLEVSALGFGCMGLTWAYGRADEREATRVLQRALELGVNFWDTAELYGPFNNEELIGRVIKGKVRENIIIATKFGFQIDQKGNLIGLDSSAKNMKNSLEGSLRRLGTDYIDLYYQGRLDPNMPIEETMHALATFVKAGKVKYVGLCEVGPAIIRRAHAVHPLTAVQAEYSLWERNIEEKVLPVVRELGIGFVPFSPLGRGFLTGKIHNVDELDESDWRRTSYPRVQNKNIEHNFKLVEKVKEISAAYKATPAQVALAWLLKQSPDIVPIPGTKHIQYLEENIQAINLALPEDAWNILDKELASFKPAGPRYLESFMKLVDRAE